MKRFPLRECLASFGLILIVLVGACGEGEDSGVGPVGPVGPQGDVGPGEIEIEGDGIGGSGNIESEARSVSGFDTVVLAGEGLVVIDRGDPGLVIEADDNLHGYLESEIVGSELRIRTADGVDIDPTASPVYGVTVPSLAAIELAGAGEIRTSGWDTGEFTVRLSGVGDIEVEDLTTGSLTIDLTGVGTLAVSGSVDEQAVTVAGVTEYEGADLISRTATITCTDGGKATVWAVESLEVQIEGMGAVSYFGEPALTEDIDDLASLTSLGAK